MEIDEKYLVDARALAELVGVKNPKFRWSCYNGIEIFWMENETVRIITLVNGGSMFAYTKNIDGLYGDWQKVDYYFLYL